MPRASRTTPSLCYFTPKEANQRLTCFDYMVFKSQVNTLALIILCIIIDLKMNSFLTSRKNFVPWYLQFLVLLERRDSRKT